jgi:arylsulfatase A-like enzyme
MPHVVLITLDQWRYDAAGFAGNAVVRTPHLDALAARGTVFDAAYTSTPVCVPARASLISGRFGHEYGWQAVEQWIPEDQPTIPRLLNGAGYRTVAAGKMHFVPLRRSHGFGDMALCEHGEPEYYSRDDYHPWLAAQGYDDRFELWQFPRNYHLASDAFREALQALPSPLPEAVYSTTWIADRAVDLIDGHDPAQPLFLWLSFLKPHHPFDPPQPWDTLYDPASLPLPDTSPGDLGRLPAPAREALRSRTAHRVFDLSGLDERRLRQVCAYYYATITHVDHHVGRVLAALERRGMAPHTAFLVTSDHGEFLGNRGQLFKDHRGTLLYEDLVRVPLVLTLPAAWSGPALPGRWAAPVEHVDVLPTVAELAGIALQDETGPPLSGRSLIAQATARTTRPSPPSPRHALSEAAGGRSAALRGPRFKYIFDPRDSLKQLYDLTADPGERLNLAPDPSMGGVVDAMHRHLMARWTPRPEGTEA